MSFLTKAKQFFGIGTLDVQLQTESTFSVQQGSIKGQLVVKGKSDQEITDIKLRFSEKWSSGRGEEKTEKTFTLGEIQLQGPASIKQDEVVTLDFELPFTYSRSEDEQVAEQGGVLGGLGKFAQFAKGEKSRFTLHALVDVKSAVFDPSNEFVIERVDD